MPGPSSSTATTSPSGRDGHRLSGGHRLPLREVTGRRPGRPRRSIVHVDLDYRAPAEFRDRLFNAVRIDAVRESSIEFDYECRDEADEVVAEGGLVHVAVDESGEPTRVPEESREAVVGFQAGPPASV